MLNITGGSIIFIIDNINNIYHDGYLLVVVRRARTTCAKVFTVLSIKVVRDISTPSRGRKNN